MTGACYFRLLVLVSPLFSPPPPLISSPPPPPLLPPPPDPPKNPSCVHSAYILSSAAGHTFQPNNETFLPQYQLDSSHVVFPAVNTKENTYRTVLLSNTGTTPIMFDIAKDPSKWVVVCTLLMSVELGLSILLKHVLSCAQASYLQTVESLVPLGMFCGWQGCWRTSSLTEFCVCNHVQHLCNHRFIMKQAVSIMHHL